MKRSRGLEWGDSPLLYGTKGRIRTSLHRDRFLKNRGSGPSHPLLGDPPPVMPSPNSDSPEFSKGRRTDLPRSARPWSGFDFIGDLHGHAGKLDDLLEQLGYEWIDGIPRHRDRTAIFLGDYVDRGPEIRRTLETVRGMVDRGDAVALMGNHEYNAIAWFTPRPDRPEEPCRRHTPIRRELIAPTLLSLGEDTSEWIDWMRGLPLWFEANGARAVHATWDQPSIDFLDHMLAETDGVLTEPLMQATCEPRSPAFKAIEQVLKGREIPLPDGLVLTDPEGSPRHHIRQGGSSLRTARPIASTPSLVTTRFRTYSSRRMPSIPTRRNTDRMNLRSSSGTIGCRGRNPRVSRRMWPVWTGRWPGVAPSWPIASTARQKSTMPGSSPSDRPIRRVIDRFSRFPDPTIQSLQSVPDATGDLRRTHGFRNLDQGQPWKSP